MAEPSVTHVICPGCERAVRQLDNAPCPNCHRCVYCGRKRKTGETQCSCTLAESSEEAARRWKELIIPEHQVARETQRMQIRKELDTSLAIAAGLIIGGMIIAFGAIRRAAGDDLSWTAFGAWLLSLVLTWSLMFVGGRFLARRIEDMRLRPQFDLSGES